MSDSLSLETRSPEETEALGAQLVKLLPESCVVALYGNLAAGKTCLVRGMTQSFVEDNTVIHSPTFTLVNQYGDDPPFYHLDLYRLAGPEELIELGYEELFDGAGICAVEWSERAEDWLPATRISITLEHGGGDLRKISIQNTGVLDSGWQERLI